MRITIFLNQFSLGGTEKAAARWARGLRERGHDLHVLALEDGPRRQEFENYGIEVHLAPVDAETIREKLETLQPDVIHAHVPGHPHKGDILGDALSLLPKIPVLSTNIFGRFDNPREDRWTDFRLFISWTSCVQAARRSFRRLDQNFFRHASVASYPLDPDDGPAREEIAAFRESLGVASDEVLLGRLSRPEPNKWTDLSLEAFRFATKRSTKIKLLLREPPRAIARQLESALDHDRFIILPATSDPLELRLTMASLDVVLHTSSIGESFGYGIAEPMNYGKPVIVNSTPWQDQAQIELVRHAECGIVASTPATTARAILQLANDEELRAKLGAAARTHIRQLAEPRESTDRLEIALQAALSKGENPFAKEDLKKARAAAKYLDEQQFGQTWGEQLALRPFHCRVRFHELRHALVR